MGQNAKMAKMVAKMGTLIDKLTNEAEHLIGDEQKMRIHLYTSASVPSVGAQNLSICQSTSPISHFLTIFSFFRFSTQGCHGISRNGMAERTRHIRAVIFDLDGTLVNSLTDLTAAVNHVLDLRGRRPLSEEELRKCVGDGLPKLLSRTLGTVDASEIQNAAGDFRPYYDDHCLDSTRLYDGVREELSRLSGLHLAVVSNKPETFTRKILSGLGLAGLFKIVIGPESVRRQKPDPESHDLIAARFDLPPNSFCSVGDRATDVYAGRAAGMRTVGVTYGLGDVDELKSAHPDALIGHISELEKYVD